MEVTDWDCKPNEIPKNDSSQPILHQETPFPTNTPLLRKLLSQQSEDLIGKVTESRIGEMERAFRINLQDIRVSRAEIEDDEDEEVYEDNQEDTDEGEKDEEECSELTIAEQELIEQISKVSQEEKKAVEQITKFDNNLRRNSISSSDSLMMDITKSFGELHSSSNGIIRPVPEIQTIVRPTSASSCLQTTPFTRPILLPSFNEGDVFTIDKSTLFSGDFLGKLKNRQIS